MKKIIGTIATTAIMATSILALDVPADHMVDSAWLKANMNDKDLVIIDIRKKGCKKEHIKGAVCWKKADYREGRYYSKKTKKAIPGYIAAPLTIKRTMQKSGVNNNSAIVFYSDGTKSKDYRDSALGVITAQYHGFENAAILDGGLAGWKKDGGEVSSSKSKPKKGNFSFVGRKFNQNIVATGEDIDEAVWTKTIQTVDANGKQEKTRNEAKGSHWYGTSKDPRRLKEGHLPGAKAMHTKVLSVKKDGVYYLGDKAHAMAQFKKAGVSVDKPIIWYCNTGHLISGNWFVAKYVLGMKDADNRVYNASMADYTRWPKRKLLKK
ncbi:MAG: rhodanese-like domain-containing protein [Campylobacterota bacterium]|nr:rhodanese-like domain-containing protein [Campylobacterota bacterium]